jgi:hypothetical protein
MEDNNNKQDFQITRTYKGKKQSDIINFPVEFRKEYFTLANPDVLELPIVAFRIVFKILNDISFDQFNPKNSAQIKQLRLFDDDFMTEDNMYSKFVIKVTEIDKNRDYKLIQNALDKLEVFKRDWYTSVNSKGKKIKSLGGLISRPKISEGEISFEVSSYWMKKLSELPSYNVALLQTAWKIKNNKHALFYLWLLEIKENGTKVEFDKFQQLLGYNYSNINDFVKHGLKPIKENLDLYSNKSFNYSIKKGTINIMPYTVKTIKEVEVSETTSRKQLITQRLHYWKQRHILEEQQITKIKSLIEVNPSDFSILDLSYKLFVKKCKDDKIKTKDFKGVDFLNAFQKSIEEYYSQSRWAHFQPKGYPKII